MGQIHRLYKCKQLKQKLPHCSQHTTYCTQLILYQELKIAHVLPLIKYLWITVQEIYLLYLPTDQDAQILTIKNLDATTYKPPLQHRTRLINKETIMNLQPLINYKTWKSFYINTDPNHTLNSWLCISFNIFKASFSVKYKSMKDKNYWIT